MVLQPNEQPCIHKWSLIHNTHHTIHAHVNMYIQCTYLPPHTHRNMGWILHTCTYNTYTYEHIHTVYLLHTQEHRLDTTYMYIQYIYIWTHTHTHTHTLPGTWPRYYIHTIHKYIYIWTYTHYRGLDTEVCLVEGRGCLRVEGDGLETDLLPSLRALSW